MITCGCGKHFKDQDNWWKNHTCPYHYIDVNGDWHIGNITMDETLYLPSNCFMTGCVTMDIQQDKTWQARNPLP